MLSKRLILALFACAVLTAAPLVAQDSTDDQLAGRAYTVLKQHCYRCHGVNNEVPGFNILDRDVLLKEHADRDAYVLPKDPGNSYLWVRLGIDEDMPPSKVKDRPTAEEVATIKAWIEAGAPAWKASTARTHKTEEWVLKRIHTHLVNEVNPSDLRTQRFFSLVHLYNNQNVTDDELRQHRAAFVKLLNSLTRRGKLIRPTLIDDSAPDAFDGLIFTVNLNDLGWPMEEWRKLINGYPYGVVWNEPSRRNLVDLIGKTMGELDFEGIAYYRADWIVATASRPPHYHNLLGLEETAAALEKRLGVEFESDFKQDRLVRAGFASSGVSKHNRLIDRHEGNDGRYYYRSYDFGKSSGKKVLFRFPLGPKFEGNGFPLLAFEHDGGEIIYRLPNGMQAYLLVDGEGKRLEKAAPIDIVRDLNEHAGTPEISNGLSCMGCHKHGILSYKDTIRGTLDLTGDARDKLDKLYAANTKIEGLLEQDKEDYLRALDRITGPYLKKDDDANKRIDEFPEVISSSVRYYTKDIGLLDVASELSLPEKPALAITPALQDLGLGPLRTDGATIPRAMWDTLEESSASVFQQTIQELRLGRGIRPR